MMVIGRVKGHRGTNGEMTVLIHEGEAVEWEGLERVWLAQGDADPRPFPIASHRSYRDRLVLRLAGIEDANGAARLRGARVLVPLDEAPRTEDDTWYHAELEGMAVRDEVGTAIGTVRAVVITGGVDLLAVCAVGAAEDEEEILIPFTKSIVLDVDTQARTLVVRPPEGLLDLNRERDGDSGGVS